MEESQKKLKVQTNDGKNFEVNILIKNFVKIFSEICDDFDINEHITLDKVNSIQFQKVIHFCEFFEFTPFELDHLFKSNKHIRLSLNQKQHEYYNSLKFEDIEELLKLEDYLGIKCLSDICYLKLGELFSNFDNLKGIIKEEYLSISSEREKVLREKYMMNNLDDENIDETKITQYLLS
jgi:hypothetical protein